MLRHLAVAACFCGLALFSGQARAQSASFTTSGQGCAQPDPSVQGPPIQIGLSGTPSPGNTVEFLYSGPNQLAGSTQQSFQPVILIGANAITAPLPTNLFAAQPAGCTFLLDPLLIVPMSPARGAVVYDTRYPLTLPNRSSLLGAGVLAQWACLFTQCGFAGCDITAVTTSDLGMMIIGR